MAITSKQQEPGISNHVSEAAKPHDLVREEIKSFHESLESECIHRVLIRWRKRKRDEELSNGTAILEKILRTLHEELESRKERAELWDRALVTELQPDRARQELDGRAAASALSLEKQTQFVHALASVLSIEVPGEERCCQRQRPRQLRPRSRPDPCRRHLQLIGTALSLLMTRERYTLTPTSGILIPRDCRSHLAYRLQSRPARVEAATTTKVIRRVLSHKDKAM